MPVSLNSTSSCENHECTSTWTDRTLVRDCGRNNHPLRHRPPNALEKDNGLDPSARQFSEPWNKYATVGTLDSSGTIVQSRWNWTAELGFRSHERKASSLTPTSLVLLNRHLLRTCKVRVEEDTKTHRPRGREREVKVKPTICMSAVGPRIAKTERIRI